MKSVKVLSKYWLKMGEKPWNHILAKTHDFFPHFHYFRILSDPIQISL